MTTCNTVVHQANLLVMVSNFPDHTNIKDNVLSLISSMPASHMHTHGQSISKTDWCLPKDLTRDYYAFMKQNWENYLSGVYAAIGFSDFSIADYWFQQYHTNDTHPWHAHGGTSLSSIYFVELPEESITTEFINPYTRKIFKYTAKEGDVITFPALLIHRSPVNNTSKRKTSIVVNSMSGNVAIDKNNMDIILYP